MQVLINETKEVKNLPSITCQRTNLDFTHDFIGNADGFGADVEDIDGQFVKIEDLQNDEDDANEYNQYDGDIYITSQENFDWWENVISLTEEGDTLIHENSEILTDEINEQLEDAYNYRDLDLVAEHRLAIIKKALADIEVKVVTSKDWSGVVSGKCISITDKDTTDDGVYVTYKAGGTFVIVGGDGEEYDEFDASIAGSYAVIDADDNEIALDDDLDCQENLTENQTNKVREFLLEVIKKQLTEDGYQVD